VSRLHALVCILLVSAPTAARPQNNVLTGAAAYGDWTSDAPGIRRFIKPSDMPRPLMTPAAHNSASVVAQPPHAQLKVPSGFTIAPFATGLAKARIIRVAPNGDIFASETRAGRVIVLRPSKDGSRVEQKDVYASDLRSPFGIAFYPAGDNPRWVYVATTETVVRFPYRNGDTVAQDKPETIVSGLPAGGNHISRDIVFSKDGSQMFVSVGSASNVGEELGKMDAAGLRKWIAQKPPGAAWGNEYERAAVLAFDPAGKNRRIYASGIRNCVGMAIEPTSGDLYCSTNERDMLGDDLVPDYITRVREGAFYGWPWYYIGNNEDPRHKSERPDLKGKVTVPDILIQPHSASLEMMFYTGEQFPSDYKGSIFAAEHGSWNRAKRTGYKIIRGIMKDGKPTGEYEDFVTGFVIDHASAWGRPVGVAQMKDGSLIFSEDGNSTIWRVTYRTGAPPAE
jgi:glucose/arabinose dehydrogenase